MDDYHKKPEHHGLSELLGDKMKDEKGYDVTTKRCITCFREGMPSGEDERECNSCETTRGLYLIRKNIISSRKEAFGSEHEWHKYEFDAKTLDRFPELGAQGISSAWYLDNNITRHLRGIMRNRMNDYQDRKRTPMWKRGSRTKIWKKAFSYRKGERVDRKGPLVSACCFNIGDRMKGNDGWTYRVKLRKDGTNFWSKV
jgi:hypothetical protein